MAGFLGHVGLGSRVRQDTNGANVSCLTIPQLAQFSTVRSICHLSPALAAGLP
jgi:hypothetical protein